MTENSTPREQLRWVAHEEATIGPAPDDAKPFASDAVVYQDTWVRQVPNGKYEYVFVSVEGPDGRTRQESKAVWIPEKAAPIHESAPRVEGVRPHFYEEATISAAALIPRDDEDEVTP